MSALARVTAQPVVTLFNGKAITTSHAVADYFGKQHTKVMRSIQALLSETSEWGVANFGETPYIDPQNGQTYPTYTLTRDGFTLLAMGFTGKRALQFKLAYIDAFNRMEAELLKKPLALTEQQRWEQSMRDAGFTHKVSYAQAYTDCCRLHTDVSTDEAHQRARNVMAMLVHLWTHLQEAAFSLHCMSSWPPDSKEFKQMWDGLVRMTDKRNFSAWVR